MYNKYSKKWFSPNETGAPFPEFSGVCFMFGMEMQDILKKVKDTQP